MDINTMINTFGFPIVCVIACGFFIKQMYQDNQKQGQLREERNYEMMGKFQVAIDKFANILDGYENKLTIIETDVKEIKERVNK